MIREWVGWLFWVSAYIYFYHHSQSLAKAGGTRVRTFFRATRLRQAQADNALRQAQRDNDLRQAQPDIYLRQAQLDNFFYAMVRQSPPVKFNSMILLRCIPLVHEYLKVSF